MEKWHVWRAARDRPHLEIRRVDLPERAGGGIYLPGRGWATILLDRRLGRRQREAALAHELVHDERQGGAGASDMPPAWRAVVAREEERTHDIAAERLMPSLDAIRSFILRNLELGHVVTLVEVAEEFDVAEWVAERRMSQLREAG